MKGDCAIGDEISKKDGMSVLYIKGKTPCLCAKLCSGDLNIGHKGWKYWL